MTLVRRNSIKVQQKFEARSDGDRSAGNSFDGERENELKIAMMKEAW